MLLGVPAEPSRCMAEYLLSEGVAKNPGPWREHSLAVARAAEKIALAVNKNCGTERLNPEHAYIYGLLHDIGRQEGYSYIAHVYDGYHFLMSLGYENAARICLTHSFNLKTTEDYIGKIDITDQQMEEIKKLLASVEYDDYDRLIQLLDSTCGADGTQNLEKRMGDVKARYGYYPQPKWDKNFELKEYFEHLAGQDLYDIIRE
jgi:HD superfamily phosphodiesterase